MAISTDPFLCGRAAFAAVERLAIAPTPENFTIWYEYHAGRNAELSQLIDLMTARPRQLDDQVLAAIHRRFFAHAREREALEQATGRMQKLVQEVGSLVEDAGSGAGRFGAVVRATAHSLSAGATSLPDLLQRLRDEAQGMAERTERISHQLVSAGERIQTLERSLIDLQRDAATDGLTGLPNRRAFDLQLRVAAGRAMNSGDPLSLLMIDIDHFKRFNDTWGHQTGDQVLRLVGATLTAQMRAGDIVTRYGGEEFAAILPGMPADSASQAGERVRRAFEGRRIVARTTGKAIDPITVSIGVACYDPGEPLGAWVERADAALYASKREGRNRVTVAPAATAEAA